MVPTFVILIMKAITIKIKSMVTVRMYIATVHHILVNGSSVYGTEKE